MPRPRFSALEFSDFCIELELFPENDDKENEDKEEDMLTETWWFLEWEYILKGLVGALRHMPWQINIYGRLWRIQLGIYANTKYCSRFCIWNQALKILLKVSGLTFCKLQWSIFLVADTCCKNERKIFQLRNAFWRCLIKMPLVMPLSKNKKSSPSLACLYLCLHIWFSFF